MKLYKNQPIIISSLLFNNIEELLKSIPSASKFIVLYVHNIQGTNKLSFDFGMPGRNSNDEEEDIINIINKINNLICDSNIILLNCNTNSELVNKIKSNFNNFSLIAISNQNVSFPEIFPFLYSFFMDRVLSNNVKENFSNALLFSSLFINNSKGFFLAEKNLQLDSYN